MAHHRTVSVGSITSLSSLSSLSSEEAVETYSDPLLQQPITTTLTSTQPSLEALLARAASIVESFATHEKRVYEYQEKTVNLDRILTAMLHHAERAGGERAKRYVASAIVVSFDADKSFDKLIAVAVTWLTHLLYIFKASRGHANQPNDDPSHIATPTIETTKIMLDEGAGNRTTSFRDDVLLRDGYQCAITGFQDNDHPSPSSKRLSAKLRACHILRRALAVYEEDPRSRSNASAAATLDILANFTRLSGARLKQLTSLIDDSSNGFLLQGDAHDDFDDFNWCLHETEIPNEYKIKIYKATITLPVFRAMWKTGQDPVVFVDRSSDFTVPADNRKRVRSISLPDPEFIRIHAAITGILNMSGAGRFFDELLDKYRDCGGSAPSPSWKDLQRVAEEWQVGQDIRASFSHIHVSG